MLTPVRDPTRKSAPKGAALFWFTVTFCLITTSQIHAQVDVSQARLSGTITDQAGAVVAGADITLRSVERGVSRAVETDPTGRYQLPLVDPGLYELKVSAPGFQTLTVRGITLTVGQGAVYNLQLSIGTVHDEITVNTELPLVDVERTQQAETVTRSQITNLPNLTRKFTSYIFTLPGVADAEAARVPTILVSDINVKVKEFISTSEVGYRAFNTERGSIDLLAGARVWHVKSHVVFKPIIVPLVDVEEGKTWVDPVIGARGVAKVSSKVFVVGKFDAGGFGISSQFTGEVFGGVGYQLKPRVALIGGYRYLYVNYEDGGFVCRTALSGLAFGVKFKF